MLLLKRRFPTISVNLLPPSAEVSPRGELAEAWPAGRVAQDHQHKCEAGLLPADGGGGMGAQFLPPEA